MGYERLKRDLTAHRRGHGNRQHSPVVLTLSEAEFVVRLPDLIRTGAHHWSHDAERSAGLLRRHYGLGGGNTESLEQIAATDRRHPVTVQQAIKFALTTLRRGIEKQPHLLHQAPAFLAKIRSHHQETLALENAALKQAGEELLALLRNLSPAYRTAQLDTSLGRLAELCGSDDAGKDG